MRRRVWQMVITEWDDYKYLGVMVSNLGVVRTSGVTMGGETIVRKAQVQAAVVQDEIRDGYDRIREGKIIWEKISLPDILYGMEVADVEEMVLEELEVIQVRLGRIWFYWRMRSVDDHRCSKKIFSDRQGVGWAAKVRRIMEQNGLDREGSGADNQEVLETPRGWVGWGGHEGVGAWNIQESRKQRGRTNVLVEGISMEG